MQKKLLDKINFPSDLKKLEPKELPVLAQEIRETILEVLSRTDGHLASSLGAVELTIVLCYLFSLPQDKIIWDVGHQTYSYKILTGRKDKFHTLRKLGGISGFPKPEESIYDTFATGHSSTAISAALGIAKARELNKEDHKVIAVVGDGALTGGMAFEGLNNAGRTVKNFLVILNDNEMSISPNVGALSAYLNRIISSPIYNRVKKDIEAILDKIPSIGPNLAKTAHRLEESIKNVLVPGIIFEELGFTYFGPVNGHDIDSLLSILNSIKKLEKPAILHLVTKKGKGYSFAENNPENFHGTKPFDINTGKELNNGAEKTYTQVFSKTLIELAEEDEKILAITAAMSQGTGLNKFKEKFPDRFFDVGIAEQHAVTFAGGLATQGFKPVVAIYSTFLQRAYDQIVHDIALQKLNVTFMIDRAGIVGEDGPTHHGSFDIAYLRHIPNLILMQPKNDLELKAMMKFALKSKSPTAIRYPRGKVTDIQLKNNLSQKIELGKSELLKEGKDGVIFALGNTCHDALCVSSNLEEKGVHIGVVNIRFIKPFDSQTLKDIALKTKKIISMEDHILSCGIGSAILEEVNKLNIKDIKLLRIGWPDEFVEHGDKQSLKRKHKISNEDIAVKIENFIKTETKA